MGKTISIEQHNEATAIQHNEAMISPRNHLTKCPGGELLPFSFRFHYYVNFVQRVFLK